MNNSIDLELVMNKDELFVLMMHAHTLNITLNELVNLAIRNYIQQHNLNAELILKCPGCIDPTSCDLYDKCLLLTSKE